MGIEDKVRALLEKSVARGASEAEAEAAAAQVQRLVEKHNLDLSKLSEQEVAAGYVRVPYSVKYADPWRQHVANQVARTMFVKLIIGTETYTKTNGRVDTRKNFIFVGRPENIDAAIQTTEYLLETIVMLSRMHYGMHHDQKHFQRGCGFRIANRLHDQRTSSHQEQAKTGLPVVHSGELKNITSWYEEQIGGRLKKYGGRARLERNDVTRHGWDEGGRVVINKQVG